jgi:hypothetical protein
MIFLIITSVLSIAISGYIYKIIKTAPLKFTDEKRFVDAIRYEERFSPVYENNLEKLSKQANSTFL